MDPRPLSRLMAQALPVKFYIVVIAANAAGDGDEVDLVGPFDAEEDATAYGNDQFSDLRWNVIRSKAGCLPLCFAKRPRTVADKAA